ncbi:MAG: MlaE family ABC transporter permease [Chitinophagales bacterium]
MSLRTRDHVVTKNLDSFFLGIYDAFKFISRFFREAFKKPFEIAELKKQCYEIGVRSLPLITLTGFVTGVVFTKQSRPSLQDLGAVSWLPSLIAIALIRALAPLVTSLICAGKIGSNIGAQLGSMRVTEQIDAIDVSGVNAFKYLVVTRVSATTFMVPILMMYFAFIGLIGSYFNVHTNESTSFVSYFQEAFSPISFIDVFTGLFKSIMFGFTIGMVGCYKGFNATRGTEGVGKAANMAVVVSMFLIFVEEIVIVQFSTWLQTIH